VTTNYGYDAIYELLSATQGGSTTESYTYDPVGNRQVLKINGVTVNTYNYDANDRFCLEGQRLVVTSGSYGADGAHYRTEIDGFSQVISHGAAGVGPAWFEVHTKSGQVMEFGHTADSQIRSQGQTSARVWTLDKMSDSKGNYFAVTYTNDSTNGQYYPIEIDYTGAQILQQTIADLRESRLVVVDPAPIPEEEMQRTYTWIKSWDMLQETASPLELVNLKVQDRAHVTA